MSPFGTKLATWFRVTGTPHELVVEDDPRKGPKKKSPWIVENGRAFGDSELIIEHMEREYDVSCDRGLTERELAEGLALRRMFEEHFAQILDYAMFCTDEGWEQSRAHFHFLPAVVRLLLLDVIRKDFIKESYIRGIGRHTGSEIAKFAAADLQAASTLLGDKPYIFGDEPTTTDCSLYGFLSITLWAPIPYFGQDELKRHPNLVAFCERIRARYWADTVEITGAVAAA